MLKKLLFFLILSTSSISVYSMEKDCSMCLSALDKKPGEYKEISVNGYRKLPDCNHKFHHCCIMKWYLSKYSRSKKSNVKTHRSCPICRARYNKEFHKSLRDKLSRKTGPYAGLKKKYRKERKKNVAEKNLADEQASLDLAQELRAQDDEYLARQLQEQFDQEDESDFDFEEGEMFNSDDENLQDNTSPLNQAFDAGSDDGAQWSD